MVRTRNSDAVVAAIVDAHVSFMGHVTLHTLGSFWLTGENDDPECQTRWILLIWNMATGTKLIGVCMKFYCMGHGNRHSGFLYGTFYSEHRSHRHILHHQSAHPHGMWVPAYQETMVNHLGKEMIEKRIVGMMPGMYKPTTGMAFAQDSICATLLLLTSVNPKWVRPSHPWFARAISTCFLPGP